MQNPVSDDLLDHLAEHVAAGRDVRIGTAVACLAQLPNRLDSSWRIVQVTAPPGGLSLSALIAQLSGRNCFDDQDDSALEIGFRRLADRDPEAPRTLLLLDAVHGLQRPVLRYLQHVGLSAAALVFAIAAGPDLDALLSDPGLAKLRARLANVVDTGDQPTPVFLSRPLPAPAGETLAPVAIPADWNLDKPIVASASNSARRRPLLWVALGVGMAASVALGAWLGHASAGVDRLATLETATNAPLAVALPAPPTLIATATPPSASPAPLAPLAPAPSAPLAPAVPPPAAVPLPGRLAGLVAPQQTAALPPLVVAKAMPPASATAGRPPTLLAALAPPVSVPVLAVPRQAYHALHPLRRRAWTAVRPSVPSDTAHFAAEAGPIPYYGTEGLPPERQSLSRRPAPVTSDDDPYLRDESAGQMPFIGTFSTQPYDARYYRYDR